MDFGKEAGARRYIHEFGESCQAHPHRSEMVEYCPQGRTGAHGQILALHSDDARIVLHHQLVGTLAIVEPEEVTTPDRVEGSAAAHNPADDLEAVGIDDAGGRLEELRQVPVCRDAGQPADLARVHLHVLAQEPEG